MEMSRRSVFKLNTATNVWEGITIKELQKGDIFRMLVAAGNRQYFNELPKFKALETPVHQVDIGWSVKYDAA